MTLIFQPTLPVWMCPIIRFPAMATYYGYNVFQIYSDDPTADTDGNGVPQWSGVE